MSVLRFLVAWLMMAALPLQGFAAASMVFCKGEHHAAASSPAESGHATTGAHDHTSHSHGMEAQADKAVAASADSELPDTAHKCGVCASCCHSLAIAQNVHWPSFSPAPQAESAEPFLLILGTPASVLDKPPRA